MEPATNYRRNPHGNTHAVLTRRPLSALALAMRYEVERELSAPDGRRPRVRTVWQVDEGCNAPRLITAYPLEPRE